MPLAIVDGGAGILRGVRIAEAETWFPAGGKSEPPIVFQTGFVGIDQAGVIEPVAVGPGSCGIGADDHGDGESGLAGDGIGSGGESEAGRAGKIDCRSAGGRGVVSERGSSGSTIRPGIRPCIGSTLPRPACDRGAIGEHGGEILGDPAHFKGRCHRTGPRIACETFDFAHVSADTTIAVISGIRAARHADDKPAAVFEHVERSTGIAGSGAAFKPTGGAARP